MTSSVRRSRLMPLLQLLLLVAVGSILVTGTAAVAAERPNILFCIADDWGWPHAGAYGDPVVQTPTFDRLAREGVLFHHGYVSSPSCTPSRGAILTGQWHWRLGGAANLWSVFPDRLAVYPEILAGQGYTIGSSGKGWGPGRTESPRPMTGKRYNNFEQFLADRQAGMPFCYWLGTSDPHRPYKLGSGEQSGMKLDKIELPGCFPDSEVVRGDVADYYWEVQRFDSLVGRAVGALEKAGALENTIIVMTGDHGMPFPRCKANLYDTGSRVPLAIRWGKKVKAGRQVQDFVSLTDLAPTFLAAAGVEVPGDMTGRSLVPLLTSGKSGQVEKDRNYVLAGRERHVPGQEENLGGYPARAIRTHEYLLIHNYAPDRWPAGTPAYDKAALPGAWLADCDNGPTKTYMVRNKDLDEDHLRLYKLAFAKRPEYELYDLKSDPDQLVNVAGESDYQEVQARLAAQLKADLKATGDPREVGGGEKFDQLPYLGGGPKHPDYKGKKK